MSNIDIDKIYGEDALKQVDLMNSKLAENVQQVDKITSSVSAMNKAFGASTGGGGVKEQIKQVDELAKANDKLAFALSEEGKELAIVRENLRQVNAENKIAAQYNLAQAGTYEKMDAELKKLNLQYKRYVELNKESTESAKDLQARIVALTDALKKDDAQRGITNRLVGDYKNQLHGLEVQIKQNIVAYNNLTAAEKNSTVGNKLKTDTADLGKAYYNMANGVGSGTVQMLKFEDVIKKQPSALDKVAGGVSKVYGGIRTLANMLPSFGISTAFLLIGEAIGFAFSQISIFKESADAALKSTDEWKNAMNDANSSIAELRESLDLAKKGLISKKEFVDLYNKSLGESAGKTDDFNVAEQNTIDRADAYLQMVKLKVKAQDLLKKALDKSTEAQDVQDQTWWKTLKAQASFGAKQFSRTGNPGLLFQGMTDPARAYDEYKYAAQLEADAAEKAWKDVFDEYSEFKQKNNLNHANDNATPKAKNQQETNRIELLKKQYEDEILAQKKLYVDGTLSEQEFRYKQLEIIKKYATDRVNAISNLSTKEKDTLRSLDNEWLDKTKSLADANLTDQQKRLAELDKQVKGFEDAQDKELKALEEKYKKEAKLREDDANDADYWFKWLEKQSDDQFADDEKRTQRKQQLNNSYWNGWVDTARSVNDIVDTIANAIYQRELTRIENKDKALSASYATEVRFIEQSGMTAAEQNKAKQKLEAETEAKRKQIDRDRITALRKQATFNKILTISEATLETTIAVMRALSDKSVPNYYLRALNAISAGAAGAAQIARAAAVQLPQYAKGRGKTGVTEAAIVGEAGREAIIRGDGTVEFTPDKATTTILGGQDQVISNPDLMKAIQHAAFIKLSGEKNVTTDKLQAALLAEFERNTSEIIELKKVLIGKQFNATQSNDNYRNYKNSIIKQ